MSQDEATRAAGDLIVFDLRALTHFQDAGPAVTVLADTGDARTVLFAFKAGQQLRDHRTSSQVLVQVLRGLIVFAAKGAQVRARAGMLLQLEAGVPHSLEAITNAVVLLTLTPSPARHGSQSDPTVGNAPLVSRIP